MTITAALNLVLAAAMSLTQPAAANPTAARPTPVKAPATAASSTNASSFVAIIGEYPDAELRQMRAAGANDILVEMTWDRAEPARGAYNETYLSGVAARIASLRAMGFAITLNTGVQNAPAWLLNQPGARYVDQHGRAYTGTNEPNLVFGVQHRPLAQAYLNKVFARLGTGFSMVRVGGGHWGELTYPFSVGSNGRVENRYFAFDEAAGAANPVPHWRPGDPSPAGEAATFLGWYLDRLAQYQNWQIAALRQAGFTGTAGVLYPSWGMRTGDFAKAVATNLAGTSSPEINGEVQRGYDAARQVAAITDPRVVVYGTWGESTNTVTWLASLAKAKGLGLMAENSHAITSAQLPGAIANARTVGASRFYVVRMRTADVAAEAARTAAPAGTAAPAPSSAASSPVTARRQSAPPPRAAAPRRAR